MKQILLRSNGSRVYNRCPSGVGKTEIPAGTYTATLTVRRSARQHSSQGRKYCEHCSRKENSVNKLRSVLVGVVGLLFVFPFGLAPRVSAQNLNAPVEEFRAEWSAYITELEAALQQLAAIPAVRKQFVRGGLDLANALRNAQTDLAALSFDDLVRMREAYAKVPGWREAPRVIGEIAQRVSAEAATQHRGVALAGAITANVIIPDICPGISATPSFADIAVTEGFLIAGDALMEGFPSDGLTILARLPSIAARALLQAAVVTVNTLRSQYDDCNSPDVQAIVDGAKSEIINNDNSNTMAIVSNGNSNTTTIVNNDNFNTSSILSNDNSNALTLNNNVNNTRTVIVTNANANTANIITNDNANTTQIINNDNANADVQLRRLIEADLAAADNATPVAQYVTPNAVGGQAELVATIVADTLADVQALGRSIVNAQSFLSQANTAKTAGLYRTAYSLYRKAYKAAVNALG
jgi:hypothetical protein